MDITTVVDRKAEIRAIERTSQSVKQRIATAAEALSRVGEVAKRVELANEALCKFCSILYQRDTDNVMPNLDAVTHRIVIAAPWGGAGWKRWGLRHWEAGVLRNILMTRMADSKEPALFDYNTACRTWHLNLHDYRVVVSALNYLEKRPITVQEWRKHH